MEKVRELLEGSPYEGYAELIGKTLGSLEYEVPFLNIFISECHDRLAFDVGLMGIRDRVQSEDGRTVNIADMLGRDFCAMLQGIHTRVRRYSELMSGVSGLGAFSCAVQLARIYDVLTSRLGKAVCA